MPYTRIPKWHLCLFLSLDENDASEAAFPYLIGTTTREGVNQPVNNGAATPPVKVAVVSSRSPPTLQIGAQPQNVTTVSVLLQHSHLQHKCYQKMDLLPISGRDLQTVVSRLQILQVQRHTYAVTAQGYMTGYRYRCELVDLSVHSGSTKLTIAV